MDNACLDSLKKQLLESILDVKFLLKEGKKVKYQVSYNPDLKTQPSFLLKSENKKETVRYQRKKEEEALMAKMSPMDRLKRDLNKCMKCSFSSTRTNVVFGSGDIESSIFIIGEAPGRDEDLQGFPFVGRAGKLLESMLNAIGIEREKIFITNIVKCRPPSNRTPEKEEMTMCAQYLERQIAYGKPKYVLLLGKTAASYFLDDYKTAVGNLRGHHKKHDTDIVVTYHPAAVLRSPNRWKPIVWEDLKIFANLLYKNNYYNDEQLKILKKNKVIE